MKGVIVKSTMAVLFLLSMNGCYTVLQQTNDSTEYVREPVIVVIEPCPTPSPYPLPPPQTPTYYPSVPVTQQVTIDRNDSNQGIRDNLRNNNGRGNDGNRNGNEKRDSDTVRKSNGR